MEIVICQINEAANYYHWANDIISLVDVDLQWFPIHNRHKVVHVADARDWFAFKGPTPALISDIVTYGRSLDRDTNLLCHCHAGANRSTAAAIAILLAQGNDLQAAWEYVQKIRPIMRPNPIMAILIDKHFALNGDFVRMNDSRWQEP